MTLQLKTLSQPSRGSKDGGHDERWGWWEDLESFGLGQSRFSWLIDDDEVPDEHPEFDPSPQIHAYGRT